jgi:hypothetical protein
MTRKISIAAFALGAVAVLAMIIAFAGNNLLALAITLIIAAVYGAGFHELWRYQQATASLNRALAGTQGEVASLSDWIKQLDVSLQESVQLRIEGERIALPTPVLTPYLVGLLVMLGLLGTFAGMVDTLKGAVIALEGSTELAAIREGLAAPIQGLSLAFGTSVAGVAASAMLGLISTISRRERLLACQELDKKALGAFKAYSLSYNRKQTYQAMQNQAEALPQVAEQLTLLAENVSSMADKIGEQLLANQQAFLNSAEQQYQQLAASVDKTLQSSLAASAATIAEGVEPLLASTMADIQQNVSRSAEQLQQHLADNSKVQVEQLQQQFSRSSEDLLAAFSGASEQWLANANTSEQQRLETWQQLQSNLQQNTAELQQQMASDMAEATNSIAASAKANSAELLAETTGLIEKTESLVASRLESESLWQQRIDERVENLMTGLSEKLSGLTALESERGEQAVAQLQRLEETVATHLANLGSALEEPMTRLIATASEAPQAAAEIIEKLRSEMLKNSERDNQLIAERERSMQALAELSESLQTASVKQSEHIDSLVSATAELFEKVTDQFQEKVGSEAEKVSGVAEQFSASAIELSCLAEGFKAAVDAYSESNTAFIEKLATVEQALQANTERSDEQLNYYVAQAREMIDHSILSQKEIFEALRGISNNKLALESADEQEPA